MDGYRESRSETSSGKEGQAKRRKKESKLKGERGLLAV